MKFRLVFDKSNDSIPFDVVYNEPLMKFFINLVNEQNQNSFSNNKKLSSVADQRMANLHQMITKTNEVLYPLTDILLDEKNNLEDYLDQSLLNKLHRDWVFTQFKIVDIDLLRHSDNLSKATLGKQLHEYYPDTIRKEKLAPILEKLGYIFPYEEVNLSVHRLESIFVKEHLEFNADTKWEVFSNPYFDSFVSNNDIVNFSFGYTYLGRQYYDKFAHFDDHLVCDDHYNYENLEISFHLNLLKPETIEYSKEFVTWAERQGVRLITNQIPIGNIPDISKNLFEYRKMLYRNSRDNNRLSIILDEE